MNNPSPLEVIFFAALEKGSPQERAAYLDEACAGDPDLRQRVEKMISAQAQAGSFLEQPAHSPAVTVEEQPIGEGPGTVIGPYKLLEQVGEGGMGTVWMAQQTEPVKRLVAVKLIKAGMDSRQVIARFEAERQALALMDHPNIAKVLDAGTTGGGRPYFVMDLVKGVPITRYCDEHRLTPRQRLELFIPVCQAVQHAHQKGVIHRDLKPSNVLVALYDGSPVPKVIDFGVAKAAGQSLTDRTLVTGFGAIVGTLEYMSPEQAEINQLDIDTRSDIYSLGVLLYELLTGSPPFSKKELERAGMMEMLRVIREQEPARPSTKLSTAEGLPTLAANRGTEPAKLRKLVRGELDWIVMKALDKDRNRRYQTANGFAADLQRYLADEPVEAGPPSPAYRWRKFLHRHRAGALVAVSLVLVLTAGVVVSTWQAVRATTAQHQYEEQRDAAVASEQKAIGSEQVAQQKRKEALDAQEELYQTLYTAEMNQLQAAWEADNIPRVHELLEAQIPAPGKRDLRGFEWHYWDRLSHAEAHVLKLPGPFSGDPPDAPLLSRDGARVAALVPKGGDLKLQVWEAATGSRLLALPWPGARKRRPVLAVSANGNRVAVLGMPRREAKAAAYDLRVWDAVTGKELAAVAVPGKGPELSGQLALSADGTRVLTVVTSIDRSGRDPFSPSSATQLSVWNVATGKALLTIPVGAVRLGPSLSADGGRLAAIVSLDAKGDIRSPAAVRVWDTETGKELLLLKAAGGEPVHQVIFSPDGKQIAATGPSLGGIGIWVWDAATGKELRAIGARGAANQVQFSPDGRFLAAYGVHSPTVTVWDTALGQARSAFKGHTSGVGSVAFDPGGRQLRTVAIDGTIRTWTVPVAKPSGAAGVASLRFARMAISPDGTRVADLQLLGPESNVIHLLDATGKRLRSFPLPAKARAPMVDEIALSRAGTRLAVRWYSSGPDGDRSNVRVWDTATGKELPALSASGRILLAISPDGSRLAVPFGAGERIAQGWKRTQAIKVVDLNTGKEVQSLALNPPADFCFAAFSRDGKRLATVPRYAAAADGPEFTAESVVQVWDVDTGKEIKGFKATRAWLNALAFGPDGALLAVGGQAKGVGGASGILVWDITTGRLRHTLRGHAGTVTCIAFSPDGRRIVSGGTDPKGGDSEIRVWDAASGKELTTWNTPGGVSALAFPPDGHQLIVVRAASSISEPPTEVWDGTPRPESKPLHREK
jgi:serine/threonine protein kinase/WD40 repeat protein